MKTTTNYAIRYPERTDPPDLPTQLSNLDDDVNAALDALIPDSGITALAVTAASGWSVTSATYRTIGVKQWLQLHVSRTGANIVAGSTGNITDAPVATITDAAHRPVMDWYGVFRAAVTSGSAQVAASTGVVSLVDAHTGATISTGDGVDIWVPCSIQAASGAGSVTARDLYFPAATDRPIGDDDTTQIALTAESIDAALSALIPDTGTRTDAPVTPGAGWSVLLAEYRLIGKDMTLHVWLQRDGSAIAANSTGNIVGDPTLFTVDDAALRPSFGPVIGDFRASTTGGSYQLATSGVCTMSDAHSSSTIKTNTDDSSSTVQVYANYPIP